MAELSAARTRTDDVLAELSAARARTDELTAELTATRSRTEALTSELAAVRAEAEKANADVHRQYLRSTAMREVLLTPNLVADELRTRLLAELLRPEQPDR
jgi:hypothetical protein